jgi:hypothetical protein
MWGENKCIGFGRKNLKEGTTWKTWTYINLKQNGRP